MGLLVSSQLLDRVNSERNIISQALQVVDLFQLHAGARQLSQVDMIAMFERAWKYGSNIFAVKEAVVWGAGFRFPPDVHRRDLQQLVECGYDLARLCVIRNQVNYYYPKITRNYPHSLYLG